MIFFTLADAIRELQPKINGGICDRDTVVERINVCTRRFLNNPRKPLHIRRVVRFFTRKDIITMPREVERILHYTIDRAPAPLFSQAYEFVSHGPGELGCGSSCISGKYLESLGGHYSTMFDLPSMDTEDTEGTDEPEFSGHKLVALSTSISDTTKVLKLFGRNIRNESLGPVSGAVFELPIQAWTGEVEGSLTVTDSFPVLSEPVRDVTGVLKPETTGFISLYSYDPDTFQFYFLAKYHPKEVNPRYHRYRLTAPNCCCGTSIYAWCELGYVPLFDDTEILIVQNLDAMKQMSKAIDLEDTDLIKAKQYEADALNMIANQRMAERTHDYNLIQASPNYGMGGVRR